MLVCVVFLSALLTIPELAALERSSALSAEDRSGSLVERRRQMVERDLRARGISDPRLLEVLRSTPRHRFVPEELWPVAYEDRPLPIGWGQTISQPYIVARMTELLGLKGKEKVLEIGTGSGYQTAILAQLAQSVYSIEILPSLSERAGRILESLGFTNIELKVGDGFFGWEEKGPFDAILVTAAAPRIPGRLWEQLKEGGRLVMPLGKEGKTQILIRARKVRSQRIVDKFSAVRFVPLRGAIEREVR